jgi:hypothetical protein
MEPLGEVHIQGTVSLGPRERDGLRELEGDHINGF